MAIVVVNKSGEPLNDRFNGIDIEFPVGKKVLIDEDAANHIFGFGDENKVPYLMRLGWLRKNTDYDAAMQRLGMFTFATFDPYAQLDEARPGGQTEQQLSPVAPSDTGEPSGEPVPDTSPASGRAVTSSKIIDKLQGLSA